MQGVIKFAADKFGFIDCPQVDRAVFFHRSVLTGADPSDELRGKAVRFELGEDVGRGPRAARVEVVNS